MKTIAKLTLLLFFTITLFSVNAQYDVIKDDLDHPIATAFDGDRMYVALHGIQPHMGQIVSFDLDDPDQTYTVYYDNLSEYPRALAIHDDILYIGFTSYIATMDLNTPEIGLIPLLTNLNFPRSLVFHGNNLYYAEDDKITQYNVVNLFPAKVVVMDDMEDAPLSLALHHDELYVAAGKDIIKINIASSDFEVSEVMNDLDYRIYAIAIFNDYLYLDDGGVFRVNLSYPIPIKEAVVEGPARAMGISHHNGYIYFACNVYVYNGGFEGVIVKTSDKVATSVQSIQESSLKVYPNPASDIIYMDGIAFDQYNVAVRNQNGALVLESENNRELHLDGLTNGMYFIEIRDQKSKGIIRERIIVAH